MSVISLLGCLILLGLAAWFVNTQTDLSPGWKKGINVVLVIVAVLLALSAFGVLEAVRDAKVPKV